MQTLAKKAWGLDDTSLQAPPEAVVKLAPGGKTRAEQQAARQQSGQERIERVNQHVVLVKEGGEEAETDMELQTKEVEELGHCDMSRGTKRALLGGGGDFSGCMTQIRRGPAWTLKALPDIWQRLEARSVTKKGTIYVKRCLGGSIS